MASFLFTRLSSSVVGLCTVTLGMLLSLEARLSGPSDCTGRSGSTVGWLCSMAGLGTAFKNSGFTF